MAKGYVKYQAPEAAHTRRAGPERLQQVVWQLIDVAYLLDAVCQRLEDHAPPVEADPQAHDTKREAECCNENRINEFENSVV
jgi:hypothetical protein